MAVDGYTVNDFLRQVNLRLRKDHAGAIENKDKIAAMEEAKSQLWRLLVASDNGWFVVSSQVSPGADDHFPQITAADGRSYDLPPAFHQMYYVDITTATKQDFEFYNTQMRDEKFKKKRRTTSASNALAAERVYYYDIIGINPAKLLMAEGLPTGEVLDVTIFFVRLLDRWTAVADSVDDMVLPFLPAIAAGAASLLAPGRGDTSLASSLRDDWDRMKSEVLAVSDRLIADPKLSSGLSAAVPPTKVTQGGKL